jgi:hypothetical protein
MIYNLPCFVIFLIKPGFKFQIIRNRFSGFYGTFCTLFKEKITDFAHNHFIPVCILRSKKIAVGMWTTLRVAHIPTTTTATAVILLNKRRGVIG